jgi:putative FmdB family regulatory protein
MPTYDYRCPNGHDFEHFYRKISDATAELTCPVCGAVAARRVSGGAGLVFKGSGFYLTDYGKNAHRKSGSDGASSGRESSSDSKSESKADTAKNDGGSTAKPENSSASSKSEKSEGSGSPKSESKSADKPSSTTKPSSGDSK